MERELELDWSHGVQEHYTPLYLILKDITVDSSVYNTDDLWIH